MRLFAIATALGITCLFSGCSKPPANAKASVRERVHELGSFRTPIDIALPQFRLSNQHGEVVTKDSLLGKVWVANFIFIHCAGPCPDMTASFKKIQDATADLKNLRLITISVDPQRDTQALLLKYGKEHGANFDRWSFLRGTPEEVGSLQAEGFLIGDPNEPANHSERFCLVDQRGHIRAYYDAREPLERDALVMKLRSLLGEGEDR
jgi:cytochrome oxidase Cu insertion factor (SCO1/SenC/PrrC family)